MTSRIQFGSVRITFKNTNPKIYDQHNPILHGYYAKYYTSKNGWPVQSNFGWILQGCILNNVLPKMDDKYNPILNGYYTKQYASNNGWPVQSNYRWILC